ncbi:hypothetical protein ACIPPM_19170 [Streptomyces sp. NPDC090119]|uniref:hypothetical protein n=1 Tax=Streptomyces sp. NPDC090119 TaxID=3365951 RepID=UPI0038192395
MFEDFETSRIPVDEASILVRHGGPGHGIDAGHHVAEEAPEALASSLGDFFGGSPSQDLRVTPPS